MSAHGVHEEVGQHLEPETCPGAEVVEQVPGTLGNTGTTFKVCGYKGTMSDVNNNPNPTNQGGIGIGGNNGNWASGI